MNSATQLESKYGGGPKVNLLTREQSALWLFQTREGKKGLLQIEEFTDDPSAVKIRYKLVSWGVDATPQQILESRLEAAQSISDTSGRDAAFAQLARDAAKAGDVNLVRRTLSRILGSQERDQAALESVRLLAQLGLRKPAVEIAKTISGGTVRDTALSELAR